MDQADEYRNLARECFWAVQMPSGVIRADDYRRLARECLQLADTASTEVTRLSGRNGEDLESVGRRAGSSQRLILLISR